MSNKETFNSRNIIKSLYLAIRKINVPKTYSAPRYTFIGR